MNFKISVLLVAIILLSCSLGLAAENPREVPGVGTVIFPEEIVLLPAEENQFRLLVNDNGILRGCQLSFGPPLAGIFRDKVKDNTSMIDDLTSMSTRYRDILLKEVPQVKLLEDTPLDLEALNNEQFIIRSTTLFLKGQAIHYDYYAVDSTEGLRLVSVTFTDSNREFWRSKIPSIIANIQR